MTESVKTRAWDPSVIGVTSEDKQDMDADEQRERCTEEINRAADILQATISAFGEHMTSEQRREIAEVARIAIVTARQMSNPVVTPTETQLRIRIEPNARRRCLGVINDATIMATDYFGWLVLAVHEDHVLEVRQGADEDSCDAAKRGPSDPKAYLADALRSLPAASEGVAR